MPQKTYKELLRTRLTVESHRISQLTNQAKADYEHDRQLAEFDVHAIINYICGKPADQRKAGIYLIDSICQTVGKIYIKLFSEHIVGLMEATYRHGNNDTRNCCKRILQIWKERKVFDTNLLRQIYNKLREVRDVRPTNNNNNSGSSSHGNSGSQRRRNNNSGYTGGYNNDYYGNNMYHSRSGMPPQHHGHYMPPQQHPMHSYYGNNGYPNPNVPPQQQTYGHHYPYNNNSNSNNNNNNNTRRHSSPAVSNVFNDENKEPLTTTTTNNNNDNNTSNDTSNNNDLKINDNNNSDDILVENSGDIDMTKLSSLTWKSLFDNLPRNLRSLRLHFGKEDTLNSNAVKGLINFESIKCFTLHGDPGLGGQIREWSNVFRKWTKLRYIVLGHRNNTRELQVPKDILEALPPMLPELALNISVQSIPNVVWYLKQVVDENCFLRINLHVVHKHKSDLYNTKINPEIIPCLTRFKNLETAYLKCGMVTIQQIEQLLNKCKKISFVGFGINASNINQVNEFKILLEKYGFDKIVVKDTLNWLIAVKSYDKLLLDPTRCIHPVLEAFDDKSSQSLQIYNILK